MAITIVVESGSGSDANANAYVDVATVRLYATNRGVTLPADDDVVAAWLIKATDYLESFACQYQGHKTDCNFPLQWPRECVVICCVEQPNNVIPKALKDAQCAAVIAQSQGLVLQPNITAQDYVTEETVGPITTKYANPVQTGVEARFTGIDALLAPLFAQCGQTTGLRTVRV